MVRKKRGDVGAESSVVIPVLRGAKSVEDKVTFLKSVQNNDSLSDYDRNLVGRVLERYGPAPQAEYVLPKNKVFSKMSSDFLDNTNINVRFNWLKNNGYKDLAEDFLRASKRKDFDRYTPVYRQVIGILGEKAPYLLEKAIRGFGQETGRTEIKQRAVEKNGIFSGYYPDNTLHTYGEELNTRSREARKRGFMEKGDLDESISNRVKDYQSNAYSMGDRGLNEKRDIASYFLSLVDSGKIRLAPQTVLNLRELAHDYETRIRKAEIRSRVHVAERGDVLNGRVYRYVPTSERYITPSGRSVYGGNKYEREVATNGEYDASPNLRKYFKEDKRIQEQPNFQPHNSFDNIKSQRSKTSQKVGVTMAVAGLGASILLIGSNLTGNVIGTLSTDTTNLVGVGCFLIGIVGAMLCFKRK